jgi:hypothetical protein
MCWLPVRSVISMVGRPRLEGFLQGRIFLPRFVVQRVNQTRPFGGKWIRIGNPSYRSVPTLVVSCHLSIPLPLLVSIHPLSHRLNGDPLAVVRILCVFKCHPCFFTCILVFHLPLRRFVSHYQAIANDQAKTKKGDMKLVIFGGFAFCSDLAYVSH